MNRKNDEAVIIMIKTNLIVKNNRRLNHFSPVSHFYTP